MQSKNMSEPTGHNQPEKDRTLALWAAGIFSALCVAILIFEMVTVFVTQSGVFYPGDLVFTPFSIVLLGVSLFSYFSIRRGRYKLGVWILFIVLVQLPSVAIVLVLRDFTLVAGLFLLITSAALIWLIFPKTSQRRGVIVLAISAVILIAIELWNPAFRVRIGDASGIVVAILIMGGLALFAVLVRQAVLGNILTKLIVAIVVIIVLGVGTTTWLSLRSYQASLTDQVGTDLQTRAGAISIQLASEVGRNLSALRILALSSEIQVAAQNANAHYIQLADIAKLDQQWAATQDLSAPLLSNVIYTPISDLLRHYERQNTQNIEVFLTGTQGYNISATTRTATYLQSNQEWWNTAYRDGQFVGQPVFNAEAQTLAIPIAVAVRQGGEGAIIGVLRSTVNFAFLSDSLAANKFGNTGRTLVLLPNGKEFSLSQGGIMVQDDAPLELVKVSESQSAYQTATVNGTPVIVSFSQLKTVGMVTTDEQAVLGLNWDIATLQDQSEAFQPITTQTNNSIILALVIIFVGIILAFVIARFISDPITRLTAVAQKVATGDFSATANVESQDEVGTLAKTFNSMVTQLRDLIGTLEVRVAERTKALNTSTEITRRLATILNQGQLALEVVEQVQSAFNYYHAHIYYLDPTTGDLVMAGGTGEAGAAMLARGHRVPRGRGLVGRAAETNAPVLVPDVSREPGWLPNVLLPETRSEVAIPISSGKQVLGVLDVQQNTVNGLGEADVQLLQSLAGQVAISLQNARSFEQTRVQAELESLSNAIGQKIQRAGTVEEVLQIAARELGLAVGATRVSANLGNNPGSLLGETVSSRTEPGIIPSRAGTGIIPSGLVGRNDSEVQHA